MARPRTGVAPIGSREAVASGAYLPDLVAESMKITANYGSGRVDVSALVANVGLGAASGPFTVAVWVAITTGGGGITEYAQNFDVPANVTLYGRPVFEAAMVTQGGDLGFFRHTYLTPPMEVPLEFINVDPYAQYSAGFLVDSGYAITEVRKDNNYYTWPGQFWFMSQAGLRQKTQAVTEISPSRLRR